MFLRYHVFLFGEALLQETILNGCSKHLVRESAVRQIGSITGRCSRNEQMNLCWIPHPPSPSPLPPAPLPEEGSETELEITYKL